VARADFFPTLSLNGSLGNQGSYLYPDQVDYWKVGVNLSLPLFNGGKDYYSTRSAIEARTAADANRIGVSRDLRAKLEQAFATYRESAAKLQVDASFREAALVRAEIARRQYNNGLSTFTDWDLIESDLIARQKNYLQSRRDRVLSEAAWDQAQGIGAIP
jgi:outer membrane protein TolC